ncbi:MAG: AMP-binding protein [Planctomycetota bacterium]|nr:AMP-binding protein [Planctomycetota bacterium]
MQTQLRFGTLIDLFNESLSKVKPPDKECLEIVRTERQEKLTFQQLKTRAQNFALWLIQNQNIRPKDKIAILGKNRIDWDVALWGTILAGGIPVLIDPERPVEGVINHLVHTDTRLLVMADDYQNATFRQELKEFTFSQGLGLVEMTDTPFYSLSQDKDAAADALLNDIRTKIKADDTAVILCTSGTTGDPREVELTHANFIANIQGSIEKIKITGDDKLGHILPPHHSFGLTVGKLLPFWVGATNVYTNRYRQIAELIRDKNITIFVAIPALFTVLAKNVEENIARQKKEKLLIGLLDRYLPKLVGKSIIKKQGWTSLRFFLSGAAAMPRWVLEVLWRRGLKLYEGYGTTENSPVYGLNDSPRKLGSVGKPINTLLVKIVSATNQTLQPGEKGEIVLGGPCIMKGYYKNPKATQSVIDTDDSVIRWLHTGDLGYLDKDGDLFITGRKKYVIVLPGGKNVNPELVESALSQAQYVREILVVPGLWKDSAGIPQETVRAIVQPAWDAIQTHTNLSHSDLIKQPEVLKNLIWKNINQCQQKNRLLSNFEKISPQHLEIKIDEFQKTSTGKIKREVYIKL